MRYIFGLFALYLLYIGAPDLGMVAAHYNFDVATGSSIPVSDFQPSEFMVNSYYIGLSIKDYFVNSDWTLLDWLIFIVVAVYGLALSVKTVSDYSKEADIWMMIRLPFAAFLYLLIVIFAPYRVTQIVDEKAGLKYEKEKLMFRRYGLESFYQRFIEPYNHVRLYLFSDLQSTYLDELLEKLKQRRRK